MAGQVNQAHVTPQPAIFFALEHRSVSAYSLGMDYVHVHVRVKPEFVEAFKAATLRNARLSLQESGVVRFDVVQQQDDPTRFILVEVYRDADAAAAHKALAHYLVWRDAVAPMMAEPRTSMKFAPVFPDHDAW
jgi:quinol monooxygenase YgiN